VEAKKRSAKPRKRLTTLEETIYAAVFVASDEGSVTTGTVLNLTTGMVI
jgi:hypothetical protein